MSQQSTLMVMAGGTGGHVYPAIAVADALHAQGWKIVWLATEGGMENRLIANKPYAKAMMTMQGVRGKGLLGWLTLPVKLVRAFSQARQAIKQHQPDVVLGMGGFAAFPGGVMAKLAGVPLVIHEQNSVAGLTNKSLATIANRVLTGFPQALGSKGEMVGNPVREDITTLPVPEARFKEHQGELRILVVGGSLGAAALNTQLPKAFALLPENARPQVIHQAGEKHIEALKQAYADAGVAADCRAFIQDMAQVYAWADLVICRAGALTVAELANVGAASILVPFPFAVDDHQTTNAAYLQQAGAALLIQQRDLDVAELADILKTLDRITCLAMAQKARALARPDATRQVADICRQLAAANTHMKQSSL
ncbi:undecaprenyldiphospho-muramoylpentapeptide beta-N-acetylglucosaminyltransferase [Methylophilus flavus]|uniref:UDP-N-acetylglucosamine--N-acetylmuramyl-(pentapeptide) pyrophosphoryl-undecaprenol N-acetylglucosamine transferase n=1 Tax=Methylophilus flavus TaxID=640084 RepID=A0ABW3PD39_9PROT